MFMGRITIAAVAVMMVVSSFGEEPQTWFVATNGVDAVGRGTTAETPFKTLQFAHDQATAGDTVSVAPGVYGEGEEHTASGVTFPTRLIVTKKLFFVAPGGRDETHIVGRLVNGTYGVGAVRGIYVSSAAYGTEFHGFTVRDCGNDGSSSSEKGYGGGVLVEGNPTQNKTASIFKSYFVDCAFVNCHGFWGGAMYGGTAIRCFFDRCYGTSFGHTVCGGALWNCVIVNGSGANSSRPVIGNRAIAVNTTVFGCTCRGGHGIVKMYNSVFSNHSGNDLFAEKEGVYSSPSEYYSCYGKTNTNDRTLFAPALGDFRPLAGSALENGGLTEYVTNSIVLPPGTEMKDFYGNAFDLSRATCDAGAVQGTVTAVSGYLKFPAKTTVNGWYNSIANAYAFSDVWPKTVAVKSSSTTFLRYYYSSNGGECTCHYPQADGTVHLCFPWDPSVALAPAEQLYENELWCDPTANAATADGTEDHPFRTLQAAMDHIAEQKLDYVMVRALPGDYSEGSTNCYDHERRLLVPAKNVVIKSTAGAAATFIRGRADPDVTADMGYEGCGPKAVGCIAFNGVDSLRAIQGFTIADGHSQCVDYHTVLNSDQGGAVQMGQVNQCNCQILDCVVTNCNSVRMTMFGGFYVRCRFYDCHGYGGVSRFGYFSSCYVDPSTTIGKARSGASANGVFGNSCKTVQCTAPGTTFFNDQYNHHYSDVFGSAWAVSENKYWGSVFSVSGTSLNSTYCIEPASFVNPSTGDYRIFGNTPTALAGIFPEGDSADWTSWANRYQAMVSSDLDGNPLQVNPNGRPMPGCYQKPPYGVYVETDATDVTVNGVATNGGTLLNENEAVVVAVSATPVRNIRGMVVNGVTNLLENSPSVTMTPDMVSRAGGVYVQQLTDPSWYVNPDVAVGDDANNGFSPETPKRTMAGVFGCRVLPGDTVHAAPGVYDILSMPCPPTASADTLKSRVTVPEGVTLVADEGAEATIIAGGQDDTENGNEYGMGTNAVRCVYLCQGATIRGFTLAGGHTRYEDASAVHANVNYAGGGVFGANRDKCLVENCIISNNWAYGGGGACQVTLVRCRLFENHASGGGGAGTYVSAYGCLVDHSFSGVTAGQAAFYMVGKICNTTIGAHNRNFVDALNNNSIHNGSGSASCISNSLILGFCGNMGNMTATVGNCVFAKGPGGLTYDVDSCFVGNGSAELVDSDYRPLLDAFPGIDKGDPMVLGAFDNGLDLTGGQRVYNGVIDIGAIECDWREVYAKDIKNCLFVVEVASPGVIESDHHTVTLNGESSLSTIWTQRPGRKCVTVRVTGNGTFAVSLNGEVAQEFTYANEDQFFTFSNQLAENRLVFTYMPGENDHGNAEIVEAKPMVGTTLYFR